ncbi:MAG TPA: glycoside hydrolase family 13 protein [Bacteroidales bacterium]|nr:glycoside hydrolase family 13 protein [Bacteroidales bacterium]HRX96275.1 glycoside hydrolase family 13 protein [Bacteroidales bacterium]
MKSISALFFVFVCSMGISFGQFSLDRVEPPFWWTGMQNTHLQIMFYGENIAELSPIIRYDGIEVLETVLVENPNYLFLILDIHPDTKAGSFAIEFSKDDMMQLYYSYTLNARSENSGERQGFNNSDAIYLITPDRFVNGDPGNDYMPEIGDTLDRSDPQARHGGDIQGVINSLQYLSDMGFTSIWLNPVLENKMPRTSYHGYAVTDFYKVDPRFGSNEDYQILGQACQKNGFKLIMDMVMNHCGSEHWWMKDLPSNDWIHYGGNYVQTNHRRSVIHDPYAPESDKELFSNGWFVKSMPDMNQQNPLLAEYLIQNSIWWIEYAHLQGIRHDTHSYPDKNFMADWSCAIMDEYPNFNLVGEEWSPNPNYVAYYQRGSNNQDGYNSCMPSMMDFPTQISLVPGFTEPENWNSGFIKIYENLANDFIYPDPYNLVIFPDNHDMSRFYTQVNEDYNAFKMGIAYILTLRGIPQIFYGTEILMSNPGTDAHGIIRSDFPGGWENDVKNAFTGAGLTDQELEAQLLFKSLLNWRKEKACLHDGKLVHYSPKDGIYVFFRFNDEEMVMLVFNKNEEEYTVDKARFQEVIKNRKEAVSVLDGNSSPIEKAVVPAGSVGIFEIN